MPTSTKAALLKSRAKTVAEHGDKCFLCGTGPLLQRAMNQVLIERISETPVPMCKACAESWVDTEKSVSARVRKAAKQYDRAVSVIQLLYPKADIPAPKSFW